jgi:hypothetical protein
MLKVARLVHATLMKIPTRLEVTPEGKVGRVVMGRVSEGLSVRRASRWSQRIDA